MLAVRECGTTSRGTLTSRSPSCNCAVGPVRAGLRDARRLRSWPAVRSRTLYLDSNDNGRFDAGEPVAPNVMVILERRFSTVTDSNDRFDFPAVATGHHFVTVVPDILPLPWTVIGDGRVSADVRTRDHTDISIPAPQRENHPSAFAIVCRMSGRLHARWQENVARELCAYCSTLAPPICDLRRCGSRLAKLVHPPARSLRFADLDREFHLWMNRASDFDPARTP